MFYAFGWEPFGSVHGLLRCNSNAGVHVRTERTCHSEMSQWPRWVMGLQSAGETSRTWSAQRILEILKKSESWVLYREKTVGFHLFAAARPVTFVVGATRVGGGRWKSQNRKNVYLSPYVDEPLNSKVIKSFVPELRSRKCFSCFEIPMFYVYMWWTFYVRFTYPISGYGTLRHQHALHSIVGENINIRYIIFSTVSLH